LMNGLLQGREGLRVHDNTQSFSEYDRFRKEKVSLCNCYIYIFVSSWLGMAVTVSLFWEVQSVLCSWRCYIHNIVIPEFSECAIFLKKKSLCICYIYNICVVLVRNGCIT
jgi:hypothetical protein